MAELKEQDQVTQHGIISLEYKPNHRVFSGNFGIQIAGDGRVWVCIDGQAFLRFKPVRKEIYYGKGIQD
jgi:hypothetical protein